MTVEQAKLAALNKRWETLRYGFILPELMDYIDLLCKKIASLVQQREAVEAERREQQERWDKRAKAAG